MTLLVRLAAAQEQCGNLSAAIETLQHAVAVDPVHEEAQGLLMRLLVQAGRRHQALRATVQREVDVEPDASLQALYQDLRAGRAAQGSRFTLLRVVEEPT